MIENKLLQQRMVMKEVKDFKVVSDFWVLEGYSQVLFGNFILAVLARWIEKYTGLNNVPPNWSYLEIASL